MLLILIIAVMAYWAIVIEPELLIVKKETLSIPAWSTQLDGFKVAVLSDLHIGTKLGTLKNLNRIVNQTNLQNPDLIVLLGDFDTHAIERSKINTNEVTKSLKKLKAPCGVIAILGNHDVDNDKLIISILKNANITLLQDENTRVNYNNSHFYVSGIKDYWFYKLKVNEMITNIKDNAPIILLAHNPDVFPQIPSRISLTLSGHTHGGIVILPYLNSLFSPSKYGQKYNKGYVVENGRHLFVTSGTGCLHHIRFNDPPEIVMLTLRSQEVTKNVILNTPIQTGINLRSIPDFDKLKMQGRKLINKYNF